MTNPFVSGYASPFFADPPQPPNPKIRADDVRGLLDHVIGILDHAQLNSQQRAMWTGIRDRLAGVDREMPPSVAVSMATWLNAMGKRDAEAIVAGGNALLNTICMHGDVVGAAELQKAMHGLGATLEPWLLGKATTGQQGGTNANAEADVDSVVDWIDPDPNMFYALDEGGGRQLAEVLEDLRHVDRYLSHGARPPTRMLFSGQPGCCSLANPDAGRRLERSGSPDN